MDRALLGLDPLMEEQFREDLVQIRNLFLQTADANEDLEHSYNMTLLHHNPTLSIAKLLLLTGADVNAKDNLDRTTLHHAIMQKKEFDVISELLFNGANVDAIDSDGQTPLHYSILMQSDISVVQVLLRHGASINIRDKNGYTPLHLAAGFGGGKNEDIILEFMNYGADILFVSSNQSPLDLALCMGYLDCAKSMIKMSLINNFDVYSKRKDDFIRSIVLCSKFSEDLLSFMEKCLCEINFMKKHEINYYKDTLYQFILEHNDKRPFHPINEAVLSEINQYRIYQDVVIPKVKLSLSRTEMFNKLKGLQVYAISFWCNKLVFLNYDCTAKIAGYLDNIDLINFMVAFGGEKFRI